MTKDRVDLAITGAHLWREDGPRDLFVKDGRFVPAPSAGAATAERTIDAGGRLCVAGFLEPHIHLDKAQINDDVRPNRSGTLDEAIEIIWARKRVYTVEEIAARAVRTIRTAVANGVTRFRSHVDVDSIGGLRPLEGVVEARERTRDIADVQIVAFPQEGIFKDKGTDDLMWEAMEAGGGLGGGRGGVLVGGAPPHNKTPPPPIAPATSRSPSRSQRITTPISTCTWTRPMIPTPRPSRYWPSRPWRRAGRGVLPPATPARSRVTRRSTPTV